MLRKSIAEKVPDLLFFRKSVSLVCGRTTADGVERLLAYLNRTTFGERLTGRALMGRISGSGVIIYASVLGSPQPRPRFFGKFVAQEGEAIPQGELKLPRAGQAIVLIYLILVALFVSSPLWVLIGWYTGGLVSSGRGIAVSVGSWLVATLIFWGIRFLTRRVKADAQFIEDKLREVLSGTMSDDPIEPVD